MIASWPCQHLESAEELQQALRADQATAPYLVYRDRACTEGSDRCRQHLFVLGADKDRVTVGRAVTTDLSLNFDPEVSRAHCTLERVGSDWAIVDNGLSSNGSFLNGQRIRGSRVLRHGDEMRLGDTKLVYRAPLPAADHATVPSRERLARPISDAQRRVLVALCCPFRFDNRFATPPSNQEIGARLHLAPDTVKAHMRALFDALEVEDVPQHEKRMRLVARAFQLDVITPHDLEDC